MENPKLIIGLKKFDVVLFDMDGVLTATAKVHSACWKRMFDEFLQSYYKKIGEPFIPFLLTAVGRIHCRDRFLRLVHNRF